MDSPEPLTHGQLLSTVFGIFGIFGTGIGWFLSKMNSRVEETAKLIIAIRTDHVTRAEFEAHRARTNEIAETLAAVKARQDDDRSAALR